jgi:hypothetical protein
MKRAALLLLLVLCATAVPAHAASDIFLLGFAGYDYEYPNTNPGGQAHYLTLGEGYRALGFMTSFGTYLAPYVNPTANEYTYHYYDLTVQDYYYDGSFLEVMFANPGRGRFYEDPHTTGTAAQYGVNPPNLTSPSTFIDGTVILGGRIEFLVLDYDFTANQGGFTGNISFDEGTLLPQIPVAQRDGWTLSGLAGRPNPSIPDGYDHQISGECRIPGPVPAAHKTWGAIKALYR